MTGAWRVLPVLFALSSLGCTPGQVGKKVGASSPPPSVEEKDLGITIYKPGEVPWVDVPDIARDAASCVQFGDPASGPHLFRLKFPAGVLRPAHWHSCDECVTVLSGTLLFGPGARVDSSKEVAIDAGGYVLIPAKAPHWVRAKTEVVLLVYVNGPRDTVLLHPADDRSNR